MSVKLNNAEQCEFFIVTINKTQHPIAWANKINCLMLSGFSKEEAEKELENNPTFEMEMYYEIGSGLFAVETHAVEAGTIYSPYSSDMCEKPDDY